ncbi:uncharacterized protein LOC134853906 isoform X2 [Symsagittifera roscoffensis]|uniref:uncharacterized protein LOC134853906 isoform X2 n=1 Tax=Symsagittifera roscoffensis TaxID=84072 RepID=UPI00307BABED
MKSQLQNSSRKLGSMSRISAIIFQLLVIFSTTSPNTSAKPLVAKENEGQPAGFFELNNYEPAYAYEDSSRFFALKTPANTATYPYLEEPNWQEMGNDYLTSNPTENNLEDGRLADENGEDRMEAMRRRMFKRNAYFIKAKMGGRGRPRNRRNRPWAHSTH